MPLPLHPLLLLRTQDLPPPRGDRLSSTPRATSRRLSACLPSGSQRRGDAGTATRVPCGSRRRRSACAHPRCRTLTTAPTTRSPPRGTRSMRWRTPRRRGSRGRRRGARSWRQRGGSGPTRPCLWSRVVDPRRALQRPGHHSVVPVALLPQLLQLTRQLLLRRGSALSAPPGQAFARTGTPSWRPLQRQVAAPRRTRLARQRGPSRAPSSFERRRASVTPPRVLRRQALGVAHLRVPPAARRYYRRARRTLRHLPARQTLSRRRPGCHAWSTKRRPTPPWRAPLQATTAPWRAALRRRRSQGVLPCHSKSSSCSCSS